MKNLRIVFMGTPQFAVGTLDRILDAGYEVVAVVTAPDRPAGRGRNLQESAVKQFAVQKGLKVLQPKNLKAESFVQELQELRPNVQVVVAFRMLPEVVWQIPEFGTFNLHASLLPQYRGAAPINWAVMNGESETGVSTFFIDQKIDTGAMILQQRVEISPEETAGSLHDKLMKVGAELVVGTLQKIEKSEIQTSPQPEQENLKSAPKLTRENTQIDWQQPLNQIYNFIRGLSPYPAAWTLLTNGGKSEMMKIYAAEKEEKTHQLEIGQVVEEGKEVRVAVSDGLLVLREIQLPGKRKMTVKDLLNGYRFFPNARVTQTLASVERKENQ